MDQIDTLRGEGTGISEKGRTQVEYELEIFQHRLTVGGDPTIPGRKEIHGWIRPVFGKDHESLTLELNDESTLQFTFADRKGTIASDSEIIPIG